MSASIKTVLLQVFVFSLKFEINDMTRLFAKLKKVMEVKGLTKRSRVNTQVTKPFLSHTDIADVLFGILP